MSENLNISRQQWLLLRALRNELPFVVKENTVKVLIEKRLIEACSATPGYRITKLGALVLMMKQARENSHDAASST